MTVSARQSDTLKYVRQRGSCTIAPPPPEQTDGEPGPFGRRNLIRPGFVLM